MLRYVSQALRYYRVGIRETLFKAYLDSLNPQKVEAILLIYSLQCSQEGFVHPLRPTGSSHLSQGDSLGGKLKTDEFLICFVGYKK